MNHLNLWGIYYLCYEFSNMRALPSLPIISIFLHILAAFLLWWKQFQENFQWSNSFHWFRKNSNGWTMPSINSWQTLVIDRWIGYDQLNQRSLHTCANLALCSLINSKTYLCFNNFNKVFVLKKLIVSFSFVQNPYLQNLIHILRLI